MGGLVVVSIVTVLAGFGPALSVAAMFGLILSLAMLEWPIIGLVAVILTSTGLQVLGGESYTGFPISIGKLMGLLAMAVWLVRFTLDRIPWTYSPQLLALLAYACAMIIVSLLVHPKEAAADNGFIRFLQAAVVFWLAANLAGTDHRALLIGCASLTAGTTICSVIGVLEYFLPSLSVEFNEIGLQSGGIGAGVDRDSLAGFELRRITGGLGDSNWLANTLVAVLPLNLFWWRRTRGLFLRSLVLAVSGLQFVALTMTYARAGLIGLAVLTIYLVWRRVISVRLLACAGVAAVLIGLVWLPAGFIDRMSLKYLEGGSTPARTALSGSALRMALERPLLGYGYGQFGIKFVTEADQDLSTETGAFAFEQARAVEEGRELAANVGAHNLFLEIIVEYGLLGLIPFVAFIALAFRDLRCAERWGNEEYRLLAICLAAGLVGFLVTGMFVHSRYLKILWLMTGLAAALRRVVLTEGGRRRIN